MRMRDGLSNAIADTVTDAINKGISVEDYLLCVRLCWQERMQEKLKRDDAVLEVAVRGDK